MVQSEAGQDIWNGKKKIVVLHVCISLGVYPKKNWIKRCFVYVQDKYQSN